MENAPSGEIESSFSFHLRRSVTNWRMRCLSSFIISLRPGMSPRLHNSELLGYLSVDVFTSAFCIRTAIGGAGKKDSARFFPLAVATYGFYLHCSYA